MKHSKQILNKYLGKAFSWFDLRKKAILKDCINIDAWEKNIRFLENSSDENFRKEAHPLVVKISQNRADMPLILQRDQDRNWFIAAYPDVIMYFYPSIDLELTNEEVSKKMKEITNDYKKLEKYLEQYILNQTNALLRMKKFYKEVLGREFLLSKN